MDSIDRAKALLTAADRQEQWAGLRLRRGSRDILRVLIVHAEALERVRELAEYGGNTRWCDIHEALAPADRYHEYRCSQSRKFGECHFRAESILTPEKALAEVERLFPKEEEKGKEHE